MIQIIDSKNRLIINTIEEKLINLSHLAKGVYFVNIINNKITVIKKSQSTKILTE